MVGAQLVPDLQHPAGQLERSTSSGTQWVLALFGISELGYANP